jgi:hypothetical protein
MTSPEETVAHLLEIAGITVSESELATYARLYPGQRAAVDALYEIEAVQGEEPQLVFSPFS